MISDLNKVNIDDLQLPSLEKLGEVIRLSDDEIFTLYRRLMNEDNFFSNYLAISTKSLSRLALFFSSSKPTFLNEVLRIKRTYLEIFIDLLWIYKHYKDDKVLGENFAKRFFQIGADNFVNNSNGLNKIVQNDPFLREVTDKLSIDKDIKKAKNKDLINLVEPSHPSRIKGIQRTNWQAIPDLVKTKKDLKKLTFKNRIEEVIPLAQKIFNHKKPAYLQDYKNLNYFTHWSAFHYMDLDKDLEKMIYLRELNFFACYLHDALNLLYNYFDILPPERIRCLRQEFIYLN